MNVMQDVEKRVKGDEVKGEFQGERGEKRHRVSQGAEGEK